MRIVLLAALLLLISSTAVAQDDCIYNATPCEAYAQADAIFVAKVTKIVPQTIEIWQRNKDYDQTASLLIERSYKGIKRNRLVLRQLGRKNAPKFILGATYLIYANLDRETKYWEVRPCGRTLMKEYAHDDLYYLNAPGRSVGKSRIAGRVIQHERSADNPGAYEPLVGLKLLIFSDQNKYETATDAKGMYELYGVPAGRYVIRPEIPIHLTLMGVMHYGVLDRSRFRSLTIDLEPGRCSGATIILTTKPGPDPKIGQEKVGVSQSSQRPGELQSAGLRNRLRR